MTDQMIEEFRVWCRLNEQRLKGEQPHAKTRRQEIEDETLTPALYKAGIDLKTDNFLISFCVWGTGDLSVIVMDNHTAEHLLVDDRSLDSPRAMHSVLDHYRDQIVNGGPFSKAP